ncbi:peptide/nickel transport system permease protein [Friedmanniella endophytica]|uniref:Peptide/nickel transport system permease protein n=1 Tax=Microlunatus kandeliicorticis TaxID=1759536 RepID=A0A7W3P459_9ACTN|nr:ABC transporter permease [Microlunatus kandeliicorticis]MBA8792510.1 peptide/nickel transport system permease protein [Microlunatus kandeliicorticis]
MASGALTEQTPVVARPGVDFWRRLRRDRAAVAGGVIIVAFVLIALLAPVLSAVSGNNPYDYDLDALGPNTAPKGFGGGISARHWFGVEPLTGRDLFSVVVYGARTSLLVGITATVVSVALGVVIGVVAGYVGGWTDRIVSRVTDVIFGFPSLIFIIALGAIVPASFPKSFLIVLVIGFFGWPTIARVVRGQTLALKERNYVTAARASGAGPLHVMASELLPNLTATIIVFATISIPGKIGAEAALSFLGVGVPPPTPAWGRSIGDAIAWVGIDPMFLVFPGAALFLITMAFNLFGDGLRDVLDPRTGRAR